MTAVEGGYHFFNCVATWGLAEKKKGFREQGEGTIEGTRSEYDHNTLYMCMKLSKKIKIKEWDSPHSG